MIGPTIASTARARRAIARLLEAPKPAWMRGVSLDPVRAVRLPRDAAVIGVGGATLGGSGRTPLAIAIARALRASGATVAFVAHGYGGAVRRARIVVAGDRACDVGDEATIAARALAPSVPVVVGPRQDAIDLAARHAQVVVVDRLLQTRPRRLARSVLAVDARAPWGSGATLPFGDLLASPERLREVSDLVVPIGGPEAPERCAVGGIAGLRVGAIATLARPTRMREALARLGVEPLAFVERADHAPFSRDELRALDGARATLRLDGWIVDAKTAAWWPPDRSREIRLLSHEVTLSPALVELLGSRAA
ncbi:MAG: tetraacyldisaccharide 4'-kinase [Deltaproteobacteria bacterium]|nr:tetraacyldisaccharide 4'-kinase [Deltaproteobacteria bacterium]